MKRWNSFGSGAGWNVKAVWAAAPDNSNTRKLYDATSSGDEVFVEWLTPNKFLVYSWTMMGLRNVRLVNLNTGEAQRIGPEVSTSSLVAIDPKTQTLLDCGRSIRHRAAKRAERRSVFFRSSREQPQLDRARRLV